MKARALNNRKEIVKEVEREYNRRYFEHQQEIQADVAIQVLSNVILTLDKCYGWRGKRITRFINELKGMCEIMEQPTAISHKFTTVDNYNYIKNKYKIDLKDLFEFECKGDDH